MRVQHGGGYLIFPDGRGLAGGAGPPQRFGVLAGAAAALQPGMQDTSSVLTSSIEMLMGGSGANGRQESRMANWSDDGLPPANPTSAAPDLVAGAQTRPRIPDLGSILWTEPCPGHSAKTVDF